MIVGFVPRGSLRESSVQKRAAQFERATSAMISAMQIERIPDADLFSLNSWVEPYLEHTKS